MLYILYMLYNLYTIYFILASQYLKGFHMYGLLSNEHNEIFMTHLYSRGPVSFTHCTVSTFSKAKIGDRNRHHANNLP